MGRGGKKYGWDERVRKVKGIIDTYVRKRRRDVGRVVKVKEVERRKEEVLEIKRGMREEMSDGEQEKEMCELKG